MKRKHVSVIAVVMYVLMSAMWAAPAAAQSELTKQSSAAGPAADEAALSRFSSAVERYVALYRTLHEEVGALEPNSTATQIVTTSDHLASAIQRARPNARQGDFFSPDVRRVIQLRITGALAGNDLAALIDANDPEEQPRIRTLRTYARFPLDGPLATMPPSVLDALPPLPDMLEYRFVGNHLVLRDIEARLILDYIPNVVGRR